MRHSNNLSGSRRAGFRNGLWTIAGSCWLSLVIVGSMLMASEDPVAIVDAPVSGHIHPSICRLQSGTLLVVFKGGDGLMHARSLDGGRTWDRPAPIATTAYRPQVIRKVDRFEVYPGTADTLPDGRVLVTWNYIADDKANDGYYQRALLYTLSADQGDTWSEQLLIGPIEGQHLGAVRHNVLSWPDGRWLLPLRVGPPRLYDPKTGELEVFPLATSVELQHEFQQIVRTTRGTLLAMGPVLLRSTDHGQRWKVVEHFPAVPDIRDNAEGRYLTALSDGRVLVTWGVGRDNRGLRYDISADDGRTWNQGQTVVLLPDTNIAARYYSARTVQLDGQHVGSVFMNRTGVYFLRVNLNRLGQ